MKTGLYGITKSNREPDEHWTKNCFNSSFPTSLACWMLDNLRQATYVNLAPDDTHQGELKLTCTPISINDVFGCGASGSSDLEFDFETAYDSYKKYAYDPLDNIDLVVVKDGTQVRPLEIKLTVFPDNTTAKKPEKEWGSELVIRSATTMYCALGIFDGVKANTPVSDIRNCFEEKCSQIQEWTNDYEMTHKLRGLINSLEVFEEKYYQNQKPVLMQVLWKTQGKSPVLAEDAFQLIVWSDFAFERLIVEKCDLTAKTMSRPMRATAKMIKCLWELSKSGKINLSSIYRELAYGKQTDKEFSVPGREWRHFLKDADFSSFSVSKKELHSIIQDGYIEKLSPERRLDQTLYFTYKE